MFILYFHLLINENTMWKKIRISILSLALAYVSLGAYTDTHQNWDEPVRIVIHPINLKDDPVVQEYIEDLKESDFAEIETYVREQSALYRDKPVEMKFELSNQVYSKPELPTEKIAYSMWRTIIWSLKFRFYGVWNFAKDDMGADTVVYLTYTNPKGSKGELERSTALERGRMAVINLYADDKRFNNPIILHETLHTFGAQDHYDLFTGNPIFPLGYAEPDKKPLYPQTKSEIMGGYIPNNEQDFTMPENLEFVVLRENTAKELGWIESKEPGKPHTHSH